MKKYIACSENKPIVAKWAERAADALDDLFRYHDASQTDVGEYLTDADYEVLSKAYDILRDFEREYTTSKRGY